ncbi:MAG: hypothetical protein Q4P08_05355 [Eubacteriales bacterium]|nr:hypothetical protein [Eubacteriales bacterium]
MKKLGLIILSLLLLFALVACTEKNVENVENDPTKGDTEAAVEDNQEELDAEVADPTEEEAEESDAALSDDNEDSEVEIERVYEQAKDLISALLEAVNNNDIALLRSTLSPELQAEFASLKTLVAKPVIQEILWDDGFIEFYVESADGEGALDIKEADYYSFYFTESDGKWQVSKFESTAELFKREDKTILKEEGKQANVKKWHFKNLSSFPAAYADLNNSGEFIVNNYENKRIFIFERWSANNQTKIFVKLLELNGQLIPAELVYKRDGEVYTEQNQASDFGLYIYDQEGSSEPLDRLEKLFSR